MAAESAEFKRKQREELIHAFSWPEHALQTIQSSRFAATVQSVGESAHQRLAALRDAMDGDTLSTAFSGIDAPATAIHMICDALDQQPSARQTKLIVTSAVEYLAESQNELLMLSKSNPQFCCFGDITSFYRQEIKGVVEEMSKKAYPAAFEALKPVIKSGKAMPLTSYCRRHDKMCRMQPARRHVAGTPCTDHSSMGKREGQDGKTAICYLAWVGLRLALQEPIIVQENVTSFKIAYLSEFFAEMYYMDYSAESACDFGWFNKRARQFVVMRHKTKTLPFRGPMNVFMKLFHRDPLFEETYVPTA